RRHTRFSRDWSSDVCSSDLQQWLDLKEKNRDPQMVLPAMAAERMRAAAVVNRNIAIDLDTLEINRETPGFMEMLAQVNAVNDRRSEERRVGKERRVEWWSG